LNKFICEQVSQFRELGLDWEQAQEVISCVPAEVGRRDSSEHYALFAAWLHRRPRAEVLEVGTDNGQFAAFLSALVPEGRVVTIDLPDQDPRYGNASTPSSHNPSHRGSPPSERTKFLGRPNIIFVEINSVKLADTVRCFDAIWLDGDHTNPVVSLDISQVLRLVKPGGLLAMDDIRLPRAAHGVMGYDETYQALEALKSAGIIKVTLIHKRLTAQHLYLPENRKYIAVVERVPNPDPFAM
jgi:predicted O-methyltransferase YrrM